MPKIRNIHRGVWMLLGKNEQNIIFGELQVIQNKYIYAKLRKMTGIQEIH